ncbi:sensor histidine kinase [Solimonas terrae]|uniref:histidine kinase n=1 Tax=Solimonas terrae TaxID=1396819 RepID=A0A6M2BWB5_9GAMM|nr:HAMP domain-containing sensor histidine kinase [Solimonas terrae]NGY06555.1 HAMP domain-containing histidine kinase [Solimonas terrae]
MARRRRSTLHRRLVWGLVSLSLLIAVLASIGVWLSDKYIEDAAVRDLMERELSYMMGPHAPDRRQSAHDALRFFAGEQVPDSLKSYGPGYYEDLEIGGRSFNLLVRKTADDGNAYLLYDITFVETREQLLVWAAGASLIAVAVFSLLASRWLAQRALAPLDQLVDQLAQLNPERRGQRIDLQVEDSELSVIAEAINGYMVELDALVERERAFAAAASHELRTPIAVIQGASETLALQGSQPALKRIDRAVTMARHELDALLALSRVQESPRMVNLELRAWLRELAEPYLEVMPRAGLTWDAEFPVTLATAPGAIAAVFTNLLRNALQASPGAQVTVRLRADRIIVEDEGPGIAPADLPHVFEPRFRSRDGGTGMGLYIAQTLALRFGWNLTLVNRTPRGAVATLQFAVRTA